MCSTSIATIWSGMMKAAHATEHEPPVQAADVTLISDLLERNVDEVPKHDAERRPCLPHHDECATDERRRTPASPKIHKGSYQK